jgi:hypothetical protein
MFDESNNNKKIIIIIKIEGSIFSSNKIAYKKINEKAEFGLARHPRAKYSLRPRGETIRSNKRCVLPTPPEPTLWNTLRDLIS